MSILQYYLAYLRDSSVEISFNNLVQSSVLKEHYPILDIVIEIMVAQSTGARRVNTAYDEINVNMRRNKDNFSLQEECTSYHKLTEAYKPVIDLISKLYDVPFAVALKVAILAFPHNIDMMNVASARLA